MAKTGSNIYKRKDGRYEGRIARRDGSAKKGYIYVYARTLRELRRKMEEARARESCKAAVPLIREAAQEWLKENRGSWKSTTYALYYRLVFRHILPSLGDYGINGISQSVFSEFEKN